MDQQSFDRLARILGGATDRRAGLKAALGMALGMGGAGAALQADAEAKRGKDGGPRAGKKRRRKCKPACGSGYDCVKGQCSGATGVTCGAACCRVGQVCDGGACVAEPEPGQCIAAGELCKSVGRECCDGRVCASGQGGQDDIACYAPKTGRCTTTADCVYGMSCQNGRCAPPPPAALAAPCDAAAQQLCITPAAACTAYSTAGAPAGAHCSLPVGKVCTGDPQCTCYKCFYPNGGVQGGNRSGRASTNTKACCFPSGQQCQNDNQCCTGLNCVNGTCVGTICAPEGGDCSQVGCCGTLTCNAGVCSALPPCTINRSDYASDAAAGAALKALVEAATGETTIRVGPGVYAPVPNTGQVAALVIGRDLSLVACNPADKPILDGGATVTGATNVNAKDLTWSGGTRIMLVPAGRTVTVDGVHLRNGNGATAADDSSDHYMSGGGALVKGSLTLKNLDITRCQGGGEYDSNGKGGGVAAIAATSLVLNDVNVYQGYAYYAGAVYTEGTPLTITGSAGAKAKFHYNYGSSYDGAIGYYSAFGADRAGQTTATLRHLDVRYNKSLDSGPGAITVDDDDGYVSAEITDVDVIDNVGGYAGGMWLTVGKVDSNIGTYPGKAILTNVSIRNNSCNGSFSSYYAGGLLNWGRLELGTGVVITGNKSNYGSGVVNAVATANVTCTGQPVSGNYGYNGTTPAANGDNNADCRGNLGNYPADASMRMPQGCCATNNPVWS